ncbi:hypothetical protein ABXJ56_14830 [Microbacterium chocolatum]|uniref:hypothetical protein n=1 Tax=Microbacterium aurantiacum TaxID=162393 RepID=UPI0033900010
MPSPHDMASRSGVVDKLGPVSSQANTLAVLGVEWAEREQWETVRRGFFRLRSEAVAVAPLRFLDWTIDGRPLRDRLSLSDGQKCEDVTFLTEGSIGDSLAVASLRALLGENSSGNDPWVQYDDGRAGVLFCPGCGGLDCGAVTADVRVTGTTVEWRNVTYQDGWTGQVGGTGAPVFTLRFDRRQYESTVRGLLAEWSA